MPSTCHLPGMRRGSPWTAHVLLLGSLWINSWAELGTGWGAQKHTCLFVVRPARGLGRGIGANLQHVPLIKS